MTSGITNNLQSMWGSASNDVFVVGWGESDAILHYNGSSWSVMDIGANESWLNGVWGSSANDVFAVGDDGTILHYVAEPSGSWTPCDYDDPQSGGNGNGYIEKQEAVNSIIDYFTQVIEKAQAVQVIIYYFTHQSC